MNIAQNKQRLKHDTCTCILKLAINMYISIDLKAKNPDEIQYAYNTISELYKHKWNDLAHSLFKTWFNMSPA